MKIRIRFDAAPSSIGGSFIEVENEAGESIKAGEWIPDTESTDWFLVIDTDPHCYEVVNAISHIFPNCGQQTQQIGGSWS